MAHVLFPLRRRWFVLVVMLTLCASIGSVSPPAHARATGDDDLVIATSRYRLRAFKWNQQQVRALVFPLGESALMRAGSAYPTFDGRRPMSETAAKTRARAAVNGGFKVPGLDAPRHLTVIDGEIWTTGMSSQHGYTYTSTATGDRAWIGRPVMDIHATQGDTSFPIVGWNAEQPRRRQVVAFTPRGGTSRYLSTRTCSALLRPVGDVRGPDRIYEVESVKLRADGTCDVAPMDIPTDDFENVLLAGRPVGSLTPGHRISVTVDLGHFGKVRQAFSGLPMLVNDGVNVAPRCGDDCAPKKGPDRCFGCRNPRTVAGISAGCSDKDPETNCVGYLVTVDGRQDGWSEGIRFVQLANLMIELGAYHAINLDGGGSTEMWVRTRNRLCEMRTRVGCTVNRVAYGTERPLSTAILLIPLET